LSRQKARFMNQPHDTGVFTTFSGMVGGVVKAISVKPVMMAITFGSLANVMIYAAASAGIGYIVKKALDKISERINSRFNQNQNSKTDE
jgi:hypothetical protein